MGECKTDSSMGSRGLKRTLGFFISLRGVLALLGDPHLIVGVTDISFRLRKMTPSSDDSDSESASVGSRLLNSLFYGLGFLLGLRNVGDSISFSCCGSVGKFTSGELGCSTSITIALS